MFTQERFFIKRSLDNIILKMNRFLANHFQNNNEMLKQTQHDNKSRVFVFVIPNVFRDPGLGSKAPRPVGEVLCFFSPG